MISKSQQKMIEMNAKLDNAYKSGITKGFTDAIKESNRFWFYIVAYVLSAYIGENIYISRKKLAEIMNRIVSNIDEFRTKQLDGKEDFPLIKQEVEELRNKDEVISNDK